MASRVAVGCAYLYAIKTKAGGRRMRRVYYYNNILLYRIVMQDTSCPLSYVPTDVVTGKVYYNIQNVYLYGGQLTNHDVNNFMMLD